MSNNKGLSTLGLKLLEFVKEKHGDQLRKYTYEPYWNHCLRVAQIVNEDAFDVETEAIALCHDLFEDTDCTYQELFDVLTSLGYGSVSEISSIIEGVIYLTDIYTPENFPFLNRATRKKFEARRLSSIPARIQTVKYADFLDNSPSIIKYGEDFAEVYLSEKYDLLSAMREGSIDLFTDCIGIIIEYYQDSGVEQSGSSTVS